MEIEQRAFIDNLEAFEKKVLELGATFKEEKHLIDYWFCETSKTSFDQVKQDKKGSYGLRIREDKTKHINELNCKVLDAELDHNVFHEYESKIDDVSQVKKILESIGFKLFCILDKKRRMFSLDHCTINIENIKGFRPAVELEIIADTNIEQHKTFIKEIIDKLGITDENKIEKSITHLYMKEFAFSSKSELKEQD